MQHTAHMAHDTQYTAQHRAHRKYHRSLLHATRPSYVIIELKGKPPSVEFSRFFAANDKYTDYVDAPPPPRTHCIL